MIIVHSQYKMVTLEMQTIQSADQLRGMKDVPFRGGLQKRLIHGIPRDMEWIRVLSVLQSVVGLGERNF